MYGTLSLSLSLSPYIVLFKRLSRRSRSVSHLLINKRRSVGVDTAKPRVIDKRSVFHIVRKINRSGAGKEFFEKAGSIKIAGIDPSSLSGSVLYPGVARMYTLETSDDGGIGSSSFIRKVCRMINWILLATHSLSLFLPLALPFSLPLALSASRPISLETRGSDN